MQQLYAYGHITLEEYELLGVSHGFVSKPKGTLGSKALTGASVLGYVLLGLGAVAEIAGRENPDLKGPLDTLIKVFQLLGGML